jgi:histidinol dehydrogenase
MRIVATSQKKELALLLARLDDRLSGAAGGETERIVAEIVKTVRRKKDRGLFAYTKTFDRVSYTAKTVKVGAKEIAAALRQTPRAVRAALETMAERIAGYHENQRERSWEMNESGATLGMRISPMRSAGLYVPGGKASYPSSVLMNAVPAKIAGVPRIVMVTPTPDGLMNPATLAAARIAEVDEIYKVGGAQAVAALAYGTETIAPVDKIVGPGNAYVAEAKRQVFGKVDIDMIAGPSEVLVLADDSADAAHIAIDLLAQAEHDENAYALLVTPSAKLAAAVADEVARRVKTLTRKKIAAVSIRKNAALIVTKSLDEAIDIANRIAPEHFELNVKNAERYVDRITGAGALFVGPWTPEALGDYMAGSNHVLPTGGAARYASPLGVYDFVKRTSVLNFSRRGLETLAAQTALLADVEGLEAHGLAIRRRIDDAS